MIVRADRVVFFRARRTRAATKTIPRTSRGDGPRADVVVCRTTRKSSKAGVGTLFVAPVAPGLDEVVPVLERIGSSPCGRSTPPRLSMPSSGPRFEPLIGQRLAPALGAASGRTAA
jgi:hypothetical protein